MGLIHTVKLTIDVSTLSTKIDSSGHAIAYLTLALDSGAHLESPAYGGRRDRHPRDVVEDVQTEESRGRGTRHDISRRPPAP